MFFPFKSCLFWYNSPNGCGICFCKQFILFYFICS
jgi:hypothetical protein